LAEEVMIGRLASIKLGVLTIGWLDCIKLGVLMVGRLDSIKLGVLTVGRLDSIKLGALFGLDDGVGVKGDKVDGQADGSNKGRNDKSTSEQNGGKFKPSPV